MPYLQLYCFGWSSKKQTHQPLIAHPISVSAASSPPFYHRTISSPPATHKLLTELLLTWGLKTPLSHDKSLCLPWPSLIFLNQRGFFAPLRSFSFALDINEISVLPSEFLFCFCSSIFVCNKGDCISCYWQRRMTFKVTYKAKPTPVRGQVTCS